MNLKERFESLSDKNIRAFVFLQIFYNGLVTILTLFVNTFLLKSYGSSSNEVLFYNLIQAIVQPLAMITSFYVSRKKSFLFTQRVGFAFYCLVLVVLCIFGENVAFLYPLFGICISFGAGYYFGIYSVQTMAYTTDENRDMVSGVATMFCSILSLVLPLLSGYIISSFDAYVGYRIVFGIEAVIAFAALFTTTRLTPIAKNENEVSFAKVLSVIIKDKNGRKIMIANGLDNCRSMTIAFYITILIYNFINSEMLVSINSTLGSILAIISAALYGILIKKENRVKAILIAVVITLIPCILMYFTLNAYVLMVFYAVYSFFTIFMSTPILNTHFKVMENLPSFQGMGAQIHTVREIFVATGRILGIVMIMFIPQNNFGIVIILSVLILTSVVNALLVRNVQKNISMGE